MADAVNHPPHYTEGFETKQIECFDIAKHMNFAWGNAFKYIWRAGKKGGLEKAMEDIDKAEWYLRHGTRQVNNEAVAAFGLLIPQDSGVEGVRYRALRAIVNGYRDYCEPFCNELRDRLRDMMKENEDGNH